ncbi:hypothetical protein [Cohnella cellulosilytica]|uniref:Uncharacterized protein n=1 Tax=Cohnella cellulosilytica TaxID=986710 RepID=A0ABW2FDD3_9BACL
MGTRLLTEQLIRGQYPQLKYVRAHTTGRNAATLYAWNENLELSEAEAAELKKFAHNGLTSFICFRVKAYSQLREDRVPGEGRLPERIARAAVDPELGPDEVVAAMNATMVSGTVTYRRYDYCSGTLHFDVFADKAAAAEEKELARRYLSEMIPLGTRCELAYRLFG